jgi:putative chitinase
MTIQEIQLKKILPRCAAIPEWCKTLNYHLPLHGIESKEQIANFLSQIGHESSDFNFLEENLYYSAQGLLSVFPTHFNETTANIYAKKPVMIANRVYANRNGNSIEESGDGYKYRGSGLIQLTGKSNFSNCSKDLYNDEKVLLNNPDKVRQDKETALMAAMWFWDKNKLTSISDCVTLTKRINGGINGLDDRQFRYNLALQNL